MRAWFRCRALHWRDDHRVNFGALWECCCDRLGGFLELSPCAELNSIEFVTVVVTADVKADVTADIGFNSLLWQ